MRQTRERNEDKYHLLRGLVALLSTDPAIDGEMKFLNDFGSGRETPVYRGEDWRIVYRVEDDNGEEVLVIISIWDANHPLSTRH